MPLEDLKNYYLKNSNRIPRLSFNAIPHHPVLKLLEAKEIYFDDKQGTRKKVIEILVKNKTDQRYYRILTSSLSLIGSLMNFKQGTIFSAEMKKEKGGNGFRSYFEVEKIGEEKLTDEDIENIKKFLGEGEQGEEEIEEFSDLEVSY